MTRRRSPLLSLFALAAVGLALSGCENAKRTFGLVRDAPDEFAVVSRAPLSVPPDFSLRPPDPGATRPQEQATARAARDRLFGQPAGAAVNGRAGLSGGEAALLDLAGADEADPAIRQLVNREAAARAARADSLVDRIIFWQEQPPPGVVVDPERESQRLRANAEQGRPLTEGETPTIERRRKAPLEGIFF